jgi:hypothetical protein
MNNTTNNADEAKRGLIACEIGDLELALGSLAEYLKKLENRLEPICLRGEDIPSMKNTDKVTQKAAALPKLGEEIRNFRERINSAIARIQDLVSVIEL